MADSTPLLSNSPSTKNYQDQEFPKLNDHSSLEEIIEPFFGSCGIAWPQILQVMLVSLACFFEAQQTFITIFTDAIPSWHCTTLNNTSCNPKSNVCQLSYTEWNWDKPMYTSIVSEWSLHCSDNPILQGLPASSFFMGCLLGGLVLALRFLSGYGRAAIGSCVLVLCSESVAIKYQDQVGTIGFFMSTFGFVSLPEPILNLDHKKLNITTSGSNQPLLKILLRKRWILGQLLLALAAGFGIGLMYYGMPLGLGNGNFSLNLYLSTGLNALLELPAFLIVFFLVEKCKRRSTLVGLSILSGVCGMLCTMAGEWKILQLVLELTSFFSACTLFDLLLIYTAELFPTSIMNATVSIVWQAVVLGGVVSPVMVDAGGDRNKILPYLVLGIMTSIAGFFGHFSARNKGIGDF
ncbi:organic cation/carnitine transporter 3-like [Lycium ferocissimum]|uniref:organic cation/carnitine transporter 3-like n=1 Tax=Lycium ferocissimum TaxID=112874 RepID=UPI0028164BBB|nr:organic cation/carnitine transporter 3-like [Lycium ferocissimum]